eukprot:6133062-Prymnesium_polylepis.1
MPFHDTPTNAAKWMRNIELCWPCHGKDRQTLPLFCDEHGDPFTATAASLHSSWRSSWRCSGASGRRSSRHTRGGCGWRWHCASRAPATRSSWRLEGGRIRRAS